MQRDDQVQGNGSSPGDPTRLEVGFEAKLVLHLVYSNEESARVAGHRTHGYATASVKDPRWFKDKDSFMGAVCNAFEQFWEEMKFGKQTRPDGGESQMDDAIDP